jgi:excisionase family DNA binding protein
MRKGKRNIGNLHDPDGTVRGARGLFLSLEGNMGTEDHRPPVKEFLDTLADLLAEKYFERMDDRMRKIPELRRLITAKEASQYLSLSTDTIYRMASLKRLPYLKIGDRVLFDVKALDHWIEKHTIREKEWKAKELKVEIEKEKPNSKSSKESDFLGLLKKRGKD